LSGQAKGKYAASERNARLGSLSETDLRQVLGHERHQVNLPVVGSLVDRLQKLKTPTDLYEFHRELIGHVYAADEWRAQCAEIELLLRGGSDCDPGWRAVDWRLERMVADRISRQLRCVGDGLAWKALSYERHLIVALGSNRSNPNLYGKEGFGCELRVQQDTWEIEGHFAILHDLTNCLTVGDVTTCSLMHAPWVKVASHTCNSERWVIAEVKNVGGLCKTVRRGRQLARMQAVVDAVVNGLPLVGDDGVARSFFRSTKQFKTHLRELGGALDEAWETGHSLRRLQRYWVVSGRAPAQFMQSGMSPQERVAKEDRALVQAGLNVVRDRVAFSSADSLRLAPGCAPFSIYPFPAHICAALICDYLAYASMLGITALADALSGAGFDPVQEAQPIDLSDGDRPVVRGAMKNTAMSINGAALNQILLETVELRRLAEAMAESCQARSGPPATGMVTMKNERATWT
jgi:hypothetical protein